MRADAWARNEIANNLSTLRTWRRSGRALACSHARDSLQLADALSLSLSSYGPAFNLLMMSFVYKLSGNSWPRVWALLRKTFWAAQVSQTRRKNSFHMRLAQGSVRVHVLLCACARTQACVCACVCALTCVCVCVRACVRAWISAFRPGTVRCVCGWWARPLLCVSVRGGYGLGETSSGGDDGIWTP